MSTKAMAVIAIAAVSLAALAAFHLGKRGFGKGGKLAFAVPGKRYMAHASPALALASQSFDTDPTQLKSKIITIMADNTTDHNQFQHNIDRVTHDVDTDLSPGGRLHNLIQERHDGRSSAVDFDNKLHEYIRQVGHDHDVPLQSSLFSRFGDLGNLFGGFNIGIGGIHIGFGDDHDQGHGHGHGNAFGHSKHGGNDDIKNRIKLLIKMFKLNLRDIPDNDRAIIRRWYDYDNSFRVDPDIQWLLFGAGNRGGFGGPPRFGGGFRNYGYPYGNAYGPNYYRQTQDVMQQRYQQFNNPWAPYSGSDNPYNNRYTSPRDIQSHYYFG